VRKRTLPLLWLFALATLQPAKAALSNAVFTYSDNDLTNTKLLLLVDSGNILLDAVDRGWYEDTGSHDIDNRNYLAGFCGIRR
jgi:hypothetical protein